MRYHITLAVLLLTAFLSTGCASIVHGGDRKVKIFSTPPGATFVVTNHDTKEVVATGTTPFTIRLRPGDDYFHGQNYVLTLTPPDVATLNATAMNSNMTTGTATATSQPNGPVTFDINPKLSPWYVGNVVFGGLIGLLIVDPLTGAMWDLGPSTINHSFITGQTIFKAPPKPEKADKKSDKKSATDDGSVSATQPSP